MQAIAPAPLVPTIVNTPPRTRSAPKSSDEIETLTRALAAQHRHAVPLDAHDRRAYLAQVERIRILRSRESFISSPLSTHD